MGLLAASRALSSAPSHLSQVRCAGWMLLAVYANIYIYIYLTNKSKLVLFGLLTIFQRVAVILPDYSSNKMFQLSV